MDEVWLFLGRFHPVVLHLPIGVLIAVFLLELVTLLREPQKLRLAIGVLLGFGAISALTAMTLGLMLASGGGYDEETLSIVAERKGGGSGVELEATRVEPVGDEGPGTFYSFSLKLPKPGNWDVTAVAGDDERSITVQVKPGGPSTRY